MILDTMLEVDDEEDEYLGGQLSQDQLEFIEEELDDFDGYVITFSHYPLFKTKKKGKMVVISDDLEEIFEDDEDVLANFAGHREDLVFEEIDDVWYYVAPGIVRSSDYEGFFSEITILDDKIKIDGYYLDNGGYKKVHFEN
jgi:hypothetical protein